MAGPAADGDYRIAAEPTPTPAQPAKSVRWNWRGEMFTATVISGSPGLIGVDGETGAVLWRRQFHDGERLKSMAGSIDALAVAIDTGLGRRLDSLDPATGQVRWSRPSDCAVSPGTPGQFGLACRPAPALGEHTTELLRDVLGLDAAEIARLDALGVTRTDPAQ